MSDYAAAVERAQSRAAVLQSLQASYGSGKTSSSTGKHVGKNVGQTVASTSLHMKGQINAQGVPDTPAAVVNNSDKGVVNDMVDVLMTALNDRTMRTKQFFKDSLRGKAIVVENVKAQLDASKASKRIELAGKRKQTISNRAMKRLRIAVPTQLPPPDEVRALHDLWWEYAQMLMSNCHSEAQLQARLYSMECVGARVYILESVTAQLVGTVGIVTAVSKNCFFLAVDAISKGVSESISSSKRVSNTTNDAAGSSSAKNTIESPNMATAALTIVKATTTLGIVLPSLHSKRKPSKELFTDESVEGNATSIEAVDVQENSGFQYDHNEKSGGGRICVLYGKHFMPHCKFD